MVNGDRVPAKSLGEVEVSLRKLFLRGFFYFYFVFYKEICTIDLMGKDTRQHLMVCEKSVFQAKLLLFR